MIRRWLAARKRTRFVPYAAIMAASATRSAYVEKHGAVLSMTVTKLIIRGGYDPYRHLTRAHHLDPGWLPRKQPCQIISIEKSRASSPSKNLQISASVLKLSRTAIKLQA